MNKRITSLALVFVMVLSLLATAVPVLAAPIESTQLKVTANKTSASPGDTITFTVTLGPVSDLGTMQMVVNVPDGLTYVDKSGKLAEGLKETLGFDLLDWTEAADRIYAVDYPGSMINGGASAADYNSDTDTVLATFDCTVDEDASGDLELGLYNLEFCSCQTWTDHTGRFSVVPATITVTAAPKPATDITLDREELTLTVGDTETLVATVTPSDTTDTVAWSSDKTGVATVDSTGMVTAVAPGEAIITAKAGEETATCTVKVSCAHNLQTVPAKESNCTEKGWDEYQECTLCGARFNTSGDPIEEIPYRALNDDHDFNTGVWGYKGDDGHAHVCTRNPAHHDTVEAHNFGADDTCDICGYERTHVCANHLTKVEEKLADCTNPGNIEHYKCSCGKLYEDRTASVPTNPGNIEHYKCSCGKLYEDRTASVPLTEEQVKLHALGHNWADEWKSDATGHWRECTRDPEHHSTKESHNPGPAATEDTPQTCTDCGYVIDPATGHLCINHLVEVPKVPATCTTIGTKAHYKCTDPECGKLYWDDDTHDPIEDRSELVIDVLEHDWADEWKSDEHNHWHACKDCDAKTDEAAHSPDHPDGATFEYPVLCVECHYEMEAQLEEGTIRVELPFKLTVEKTGELDPGKEIFKFMAEEFGAPVEYELITSTLETNGAKTYDGVFVFTIKERDADNLSEGFIFCQVKGDAEGWTYDETKFYAVPIYNENDDGV